MTVVAHHTRSEWGRGVAAERLPDRTRYVFEDGVERTFMHGNALLVEVDVPANEREALAKLLSRRRPAAKDGAKKKIKVKTAESSTTFEKQQTAFTARFPGGFADPAYAQQERGTAEDPSIDALIAVARELLAVERLDAAIASGAFADVYADAVKVIMSARKLAFPKADSRNFERAQPSGHERFARALRDLLYGQGAYEPRFDAFVKALGGKTTPWTIATVFAAAVHPDAHVLVKPTVSQRQASVLGIAGPPIGAPTGTGYAKHLRVAEALRARLIAASQTPRDLFDAYTYQWRTLSKGALATAAKAAAATA